MQTTPISDRPSFDLALLGWGTHGVDQITVEQLRILGRAHDIVVDPGATPDIFELLEQYPGEVHDLGPMYRDGARKGDLYPAMAEYALDLAQRRGGTAVLAYGHPLLYSTPSRILIREARARRLRLRICAGISSIAQIMCVLELDIAERNLQILFANHILAQDLHIDPRVDLLIMQPGGLGEVAILRNPDQRDYRDVTAYEELQERLLRVFAADHPITSVCVADQAGDAHEVVSFPVSEILSRARGLHYGHTWYVQASESAVVAAPSRAADSRVELETVFEGEER